MIFAGRLYTAVLAVHFLLTGGIAQQVTFKHLTARDGLNNSYVLAVSQDAEGFIWIGTTDGLHRYDGYDFDLYLHDARDPNSISDNMIQLIRQDPHFPQIIWIGTSRGGLNRYDKCKNGFRSFTAGSPDGKRLTDNTVSDLLFLPDSSMLIVTANGLSRARYGDRDSITIRPVPIPHGVIQASARFRTVALDPEAENLLWIGSTKGLGLLDLDQPLEKQKIPGFLSAPMDIRDLHFDSRNRLWLATYGNGLLHFDRGQDTCRTCNLSNGLTSDNVRAVFEDLSGILWVATNDGLVRMNPDAGILNIMQHRSYDSHGLLHKSVFGVFEDMSGVIWAWCPLGINLLSREMMRFMHYYHDPVSANTILEGIIFSIIADKEHEDILWIASENGLNRFDLARNAFTNITFGDKDPRFNHLRSLAFGRPGELWIGSSNGLIQMNTRTGAKKFYYATSSPENGLSHRRVRDLYFDNARQNLWIATDFGLNRLDLKTGRFKYYLADPEDPHALPANSVSVIYHTPDLPPNSFWIGTSNGLCRFNADTEKFLPFTAVATDARHPEMDHILCLLKDRENPWLYAGTEGRGIFVINTVDSTIFSHDAIDGLPGNSVYDIDQDADGNLWVITSKGICQLTPAGQRLEVNFASDYPEQFLENPQTCFIHPNGKLFFGSRNGLAIYEPETETGAAEPPPIRLTAVKVDQRHLNLYPYIRNNQPLECSYQENDLSISFAALDFSPTGKQVYAFQLQGIDDDWVYGGPRHEASYPNLAPGAYRFRVRSAGMDGRWYESETPLRIIISPPFWATWWFRGILLTAFFSALLFYHRSRLAKISRHRRELQELNRDLNREIADRRKAEENYKKLNAELEDRVAQRTEQLEQTNRELESFAYSVSHDLKAPLRSIEGFSKILDEEFAGQIDVAGLDYLNRVKSAAQNASRMIDEILKLSRATRGEIVRQEINISELVRKSLNELAQTDPERKHEFLIEPGILVSADIQLLPIVVNNLIENAWKFTSKIPATRIAFGRNPQDPQEMYLKDNGVGFDMNYYDKLFKPFQRLHSTSEFSGSGIGLASVRRVITRHGGTIRAESQIDVGTTIYFKFQ